jgi:hypothetical protein
MPKIPGMHSREPSSPFRRRAAVSLLLGVFLFGSNYCLLAAAAAATPAAARLACHATPEAGASADHGCCNRPSAPSDGPPRASYPCCIQVAPPAVTAVDALAADAAVALAAESAIELPPPAVAWAPRVETAGESPPAPPPAVLRGRAPPIAS